MELKEYNIVICGISETKRTGKGTRENQDYIFIYNGKVTYIRTTEGVVLLIKNTYKPKMNIKMNRWTETNI